eukprot:CAMPEP_0182422622 /NCGR_PEP_ID=MMETSP1167-20130531/8350_1 /TAXON_ID=2988 /ORGANISM="Mallomonas Sp, Strain CCMP3275" /LENGTH=285 /DNA_ID=CAMNT_0024600815 /DNA_START=12 /DNA_END=865 /DNA_ORIENTATION=-
MTIPWKMHNELMTSYAGGITFLDKQIGRVLDVVDELSLWNNLTIVLTSDHGMHNGEKGIWEKWSLFDESTHVPLMIHHPSSPYKGHHYRDPVELIDIFPTLNELLAVPDNPDTVCTPGENDTNYIYECLPLEGKSLARIILGDQNTTSVEMSEEDIVEATERSDRVGAGRLRKRWGNAQTSSGETGSTSGKRETGDRKLTQQETSSSPGVSKNLTHTRRYVVSSSLEKDFAITQSWRCAKKKHLLSNPHRRKNVWIDCQIEDSYNGEGDHQISVLGYSMRTMEYR